MRTCPSVASDDYVILEAAALLKSHVRHRGFAPAISDFYLWEHTWVDLRSVACAERTALVLLIQTDCRCVRLVSTQCMNFAST